jgi:serine/threonine protein phosphatase PrpC
MCETLIESALSAGADDNLTTLVLRMSGTNQSGVETKVHKSIEE